MQNDVEHIVLTRFNLVGIGGLKSEQEWETWNKHRFQLFKEYCLPSMLQQSASFKWHLYFDEQTPEEHLPDIEELKRHSFIRIFFLNGKNTFFRDHMSGIQKNLSPGTRWLISTRVDNDDCLHKDAISAIQSRFIPQDQFIINLSSGYTFQMETGYMSHYYYLKSPFLSLVEDVGKDELKGVYLKRHSQWEPGKAAPWGRVIKSSLSRKQNHAYIVDRPYWLQLIHGKNVSNDDLRGFPVLRSFKLGDYGINKQGKTARISMIPRYYNFIWWKRYAKGLILKLFFSKPGS